MDYEAMLERGREKLPEGTERKSRFEVPKARGHIQGARTVWSNFKQIAQTLNRPEKHLLKFVLKELATPGELHSKGLLLGAKIPASKINEKIQQYADLFVTCPECGKPDTKLIRDGSITIMRCSACGARHSVNSKI